MNGQNASFLIYFNENCSIKYILDSFTSWKNIFTILQLIWARALYAILEFGLSERKKINLNIYF